MNLGFSFTGSKESLAVNSCTSALHLALISKGIGKNDEVIIPDVSWPSTGNVVHLVNSKPVLADINTHDFNISIDSVQSLITSKTKAIMPVDTFGYPCDASPLEDICEDKGISLIVDTACSLGSEYNGVSTGNFGDMSCFSLHAKKL